MYKCKKCNVPFFLIKERDEHEKDCSFVKERKVIITDEDSEQLKRALVIPEDYNENEDRKE